MARKQLQRLPKRIPPPPAPTRPKLTSGVIGGILLAVGAIWLMWIWLHQFTGSALPTLPIIGFAATPQSGEQISPLVAAGITLGHTDQPPGLNQQQAVLIANQLEPDAATRSKSTTAQYVLVTYPNNSTPASHPDLKAVPAWMILYQRIPLEPADASVDPTPFPHSYYDLYVFLDANSGKELLVIQV